MTTRADLLSAPGALEVVGPPGAGKSSLAAALANHSNGVRVVKRYRATRHLPWMLWSGLAVAPAILRDPAGHSLSLQQLRWMVRVEAGSRMLERRHPRRTAIVFDQGPIYTLGRLSNVFAPTHNDPLAHWRQAKMRQLAAHIDLVVVLDAPDVVLMRRIRSRSKAHPIKDTPARAAFSALMHDRAVLAVVLGELACQHRPRVLQLDSSRTTLPNMVGAVVEAWQRTSDSADAR